MYLDIQYVSNADFLIWKKTKVWLKHIYCKEDRRVFLAYMVGIFFDNLETIMSTLFIVLSNKSALNSLLLWIEGMQHWLQGYVLMLLLFYFSIANIDCI